MEIHKQTMNLLEQNMVQKAPKSEPMNFFNVSKSSANYGVVSAVNIVEG